MSDTIVKSILNSDALHDAVTDAITEAVDAQFSALRQHLIDSGIDADVVDEHMGTFQGAKSSAPMRRMLGPNKSTDTGGKSKAPAKIFASKDPGNSKENLKRKFDDGEVVIVRNYGQKSHAIFGAFNSDKKLSKFKDNYLKETTWIKPNGRLAFGFGWVIMDMTKLSEVEKAFDKANIEYRTVERKDYEKEIRAGQKSKTAAISEDDSGDEGEPAKSKPKAKAEVKTKPKAKEAPPPAKKPKAKAEVKTKPKAKAEVKPKAAPPAKKPKAEVKTKAAPAKKPKAKAEVKPKAKEAPPAKSKTNPRADDDSSDSNRGGRLKAVKNDWDNNEEPDTGFIFMMLPVGTKNKKVPVAVGWQDPDADEDQKGLASVLPFDGELEEECTKKKWRHLTEEMIEEVRAHDSDTAEQLEEMMTRDIEGSEEGSDVEESGEEELSDDDEVFDGSGDDPGSDDEGLSGSDDGEGVESEED